MVRRKPAAGSSSWAFISHTSAAKGFDLLMLLANEDGRVCTEAEVRDLGAAAGPRLARLTASPKSILEGPQASRHPT